MKIYKPKVVSQCNANGDSEQSHLRNHRNEAAPTRLQRAAMILDKHFPLPAVLHDPPTQAAEETCIKLEALADALGQLISYLHEQR